MATADVAELIKQTKPHISMIRFERCVVRSSSFTAVIPLVVLSAKISALLLALPSSMAGLGVYLVRFFL
ncbi:hypothetical protein HMPREF1487_09517 [Pseudomonas sp. HPB0071]|uniref:Uncharacterized protein n=1 Tax=Pseudomonas luteola TaxID=47886 RepID=A0A2X2BYW7_PSELU|nr:hypothetical protein HMPREF1487_09517 [Pseudomonas sp. HPB0071]SPZ00018.1 Uncharacterised protein [Pseudomonas luteola]